MNSAATQKSAAQAHNQEVAETPRNSVSKSLRREVIEAQTQAVALNERQRTFEQRDAVEHKRLMDVLDPKVPRDEARHLAMLARRAARRALVQPLGAAAVHLSSLFDSSRGRT